MLNASTNNHTLHKIIAIINEKRNKWIHSRLFFYESKGNYPFIDKMKEKMFLNHNTQYVWKWFTHASDQSEKPLGNSLTHFLWGNTFGNFYFIGMLYSILLSIEEWNDLGIFKLVSDGILSKVLKAMDQFFKGIKLLSIRFQISKKFLFFFWENYVKIDFILNFVNFLHFLWLKPVQIIKMLKQSSSNDNFEYDISLHIIQYSNYKCIRSILHLIFFHHSS